MDEGLQHTTPKFGEKAKTSWLEDLNGLPFAANWIAAFCHATTHVYSDQG